MPVSVKKKPTVPNIASSLNMISGDQNDVVETSVQTQTGAPVQNAFSYTQQTVTESAPVAAPNPAMLKKSTKDTQIIFRTTEDNKNNLKGFFATYGITLSKGIQMACFYLEQQIKAGSVEINSAGIITKQERR